MVIFSNTLFARPVNSPKISSKSPNSDFNALTVFTVSRETCGLYTRTAKDGSFLDFNKGRINLTLFKASLVSVSVVMPIFDQARFSSIKGTLEAIASTSSIDEEGAIYYSAHVKLLQNFVGIDPDKNPVLPGMTAQLSIITGQRTFLEYLLRPAGTSKNM